MLIAMRRRRLLAALVLNLLLRSRDLLAKGYAIFVEDNILEHSRHVIVTRLECTKVIKKGI